MKTHAYLRAGLLQAVLLLFIIHPWQVAAQVRVNKVSDASVLAGKNGIVYNLPRTVVNVDLAITLTRQFAGPLAAYASEYIGLDNVIKKDVITYDIGHAEISTATEPDPGQVYIIEKEEKSPEEIWISFDGNAPVLAMETFDKDLTPKSFSNWHEGLFSTPDPAMLFLKYTESMTREVVDTIIRKVSIDTLVFEQVTLRSSRVEYSDVEKAQQAAAEISQIENDEYNLLIGYQETAYSKESLEYLLSRLGRLKQEYLKLFTGVSTTETLHFNFVVFPVKDNTEGEYFITGFSKSNGMTDEEGQNAIVLNLKPDYDFGNFDRVSGTGIVYRLPGTVSAALTYQGVELVSKRIDVLQFGPLLSLPSSVHRVEFDSNTGALKTVIMQ